MITFQCQEPNCGHREWSRSGLELRDLMNEHKRGHEQYRALQPMTFRYIDGWPA